MLHVVSGLAPDNRFGGVTRVALAIAAAQRQDGDLVLLAGAAFGYRRLPRRVDDVQVILARGTNPTPALGLGSVMAPALLPKLVRVMLTADVVHVHLGRDLVSLSAALLARVLRRTLIVQTHGMLDASTMRLAGIIDLLLTRPALLGASAALVLTDAERTEIDRLTTSRLPVFSFPNGVESPESALALSERSNDVVFLARLHPRKGALAFARTSVVLTARFPQMRFRILGPDEGDAAPVGTFLETAGSPANVLLEGAVEHRLGLQLLAAARILVLPAVEEPFGMTLLEAMAAGTPVVVHESAALAGAISTAGAGATFGEACGRSLDDAIVSLFGDDDWRTASAAARMLVQRRFTLKAVIRDLRMAYSTAD